MISRYAWLDDVPGMAVALDNGCVYFLMPDPALAPVHLSNADIARLTLLGTVAATEEARYLDTLAGGAAKIVCNRTSER